MNTDNKELLLAAIDDYSVYTPAQRKLLQTLVNLAVDGTVFANVADLMKITNISRATIYTALEMLEKEGAIEISDLKGVKFSSCKLRQSKLNELIHYYLKKQELIRK